MSRAPSSARQVYLSKRTCRAGGRRFRVGPQAEVSYCLDFLFDNAATTSRMFLIKS